MNVGCGQNEGPCSIQKYPLNPSYIVCFVVSGYNYKKEPLWRTECDFIRPIVKQINANTLSSRWIFRKKDNKSAVWYFVTLEDIFPTVYEEITNTYCMVSRVNRISGRTLWKISPQ